MYRITYREQNQENNVLLEEFAETYSKAVDIVNEKKEDGEYYDFYIKSHPFETSE